MIKSFALNENNYFNLDLDNLSETDQAIVVLRNPEAIQRFKNPSTVIQLISLQDNPHNIQHIQNPSPLIQAFAIKQAESSVTWIKNLDHDVILEQLRIFPHRILDYLDELSEEQQIIVIEKYPSLLEKIKNPTENSMNLALKLSKKPASIFSLIKNPTLNQCIYALENEEPSLDDLGDPHYFIFRTIKIVDNPDHFTTLKNLYNKKQVLERLK